MNQKELKELIEFLVEKDIAEFELERGDVKVRIKRAGDQLSVTEPRLVAPLLPAGLIPGLTTPGVAPSPAGHAGAAPPAGAAQPAAEEAGLHVVKSPIVGTYYESPSPGSPPFVKEGDSISVGQVLCIIEAMKLMNEIESDVAGELVKRLATNGQPVEYGQGLFAVRPK